jgi:hypothetical protein
VVFRSPLIAKVLGAGGMSVSGLPALRDYWTKVLARVPGALQFEILQVGVGVGGHAITIRYRNERGQEMADTLVFGEDGKVSKGYVDILKYFPS